MSTETTIVLDRIQEVQDKIFQGSQDLQDRILEINTKAAAELNERSPRLADVAGRASDASAELQTKFIELSDKGRTEAKERFDAIADQIEEVFTKVRDRLPEGRDLNLGSISSVEFPTARELLDNSRTMADRGIEMNRSFAKSVVAAWAPVAPATKKTTSAKTTKTATNTTKTATKAAKSTAKGASTSKAAAKKSSTSQSA
ncbi:MAG: hypothetical protein GXP35_08740 [Actinobacteria bacterium]|nr:hypothetical protein [Actinomycetota bacterium]